MKMDVIYQSVMTANIMCQADQLSCYISAITASALRATGGGGGWKVCEKFEDNCSSNVRGRWTHAQSVVNYVYIIYSELI